MSTVIGIISSQHRKWLGHIMRRGSVLRTIIEGGMEGKRQEEDGKCFLTSL